MPHISKMSSHRYLNVSDVKDRPKTVTIKSCAEEDVSMKDQAPDIKWVLKFHEITEGLVLGATNNALIALALNDEVSENWIGKRIVLHNDPTVMMGTKLTGGVRVRAEGNPIPVQTPPPAPAPQSNIPEYANPNPEYDGQTPTPANDSDDIPF